MRKIEAAAGYDNLDSDSDSDSSACVVPVDASLDEDSGALCGDEVRVNIVVSSEAETSTLRC